MLFFNSSTANVKVRQLPIRTHSPQRAATAAANNRHCGYSMLLSIPSISSADIACFGAPAHIPRESCQWKVGPSMILPTEFPHLQVQSLFMDSEVGSFSFFFALGTALTLVLRFVFYRQPRRATTLALTLALVLYRHCGKGILQFRPERVIFGQKAIKITTRASINTPRMQVCCI